MLTPQNDEEWKALRLHTAMYPGEADGFPSEIDRDAAIRTLATARAIVREELSEKGAELAKVREEIRLRSEVLRALPNEASQQMRLSWLLRRERELMGEEWTT